MGCSILCMFTQLPLFKRTTPPFKNNIYATVHSLPLKRSLHSKHFSSWGSPLCFSPPSHYIFSGRCALADHSWWRRGSLTPSSPTPSPSPPSHFLASSALGRHSIMSRAAAKPLAGLGSGEGVRGETSLPGQNLLSNRHTPQLPAPDTFRAAKSPPTLSLYLIPSL